MGLIGDKSDDNTLDYYKTANSYYGLNAWARRSFTTALDKGFHPGAEGHPAHKDPTRIASRIALIHAELSEALEACARNDMELRFEPDGKPEGFGVELADVFLRLVDLAYSTSVDLEKMVALKHEYNQTRPLRHGGKRL